MSMPILTEIETSNSYSTSNTGIGIASTAATECHPHGASTHGACLVFDLVSGTCKSYEQV